MADEPKIPKIAQEFIDWIESFFSKKKKDTAPEEIIDLVDTEISTRAKISEKESKTRKTEILAKEPTKSKADFEGYGQGADIDLVPGSKKEISVQDEFARRVAKKQAEDKTEEETSKGISRGKKIGGVSGTLGTMASEESAAGGKEGPESRAAAEQKIKPSGSEEEKAGPGEEISEGAKTAEAIAEETSSWLSKGAKIGGIAGAAGVLAAGESMASEAEEFIEAAKKLKPGSGGKEVPAGEEGAGGEEGGTGAGGEEGGTGAGGEEGAGGAGGEEGAGGAGGEEGGTEAGGEEGGTGAGGEEGAGSAGGEEGGAGGAGGAGGEEGAGGAGGEEGGTGAGGDEGAGGAGGEEGGTGAGGDEGAGGAGGEEGGSGAGGAGGEEGGSGAGGDEGAGGAGGEEGGTEAGGEEGGTEAGGEEGGTGAGGEEGSAGAGGEEGGAGADGFSSQDLAKKIADKAVEKVKKKIEENKKKEEEAKAKKAEEGEEEKAAAEGEEGDVGPESEEAAGGGEEGETGTGDEEGAGTGEDEAAAGDEDVGLVEAGPGEEESGAEAGEERLFASVTTSLNKKLKLHSCKGAERLNDAFDYTLIMYSNDPNIDFKKVLHKEALVTIDIDDKPRYIHGIVGELIQSHTGIEKKTYYIAKLYPSLWFLKSTRDCRIFENMSTMDIVQQVLNDNGVNDIDDRTTSRGKDTREYVVQYNESCYDFICRLLEYEGIFFFFHHTDSSHVLVFGDDSSAFLDCENIENAEMEIGSAPESFVRTVQSCDIIERTVPKEHGVADYNFESASNKLYSAESGKGLGGRIYEYPGKYSEKDVGDSLAKIYLESEEALGKIIDGKSTIPDFYPGGAFTLDGHIRDDANQKWALYEVKHDVEVDVTEGKSTYDNNYIAFPIDIQYRPARITHVPKIYSNQTAIVTGPEGEEISTDNYGRVQVLFHWDQEQKPSCWMRVAQAWTGNAWGALFIPRIGQEVIISYVDGDPDRPMVTGCVYNGDNLPPYLPDEPTKSGFKTNSSKGGDGFNEFRFNDLKDQEEIYTHAQGDMNTDIEQNRVTTIVNGDDTLELQNGSRTVKVDVGDETHINGANFTHNVAGDYVLEIDGNLTIKANNIKIIAKEKIAQNALFISSSAETLNSISSLGKASLSGAFGASVSSYSSVEIMAGIGLPFAGPIGPYSKMELKRAGTINMTAFTKIDITSMLGMTLEATTLMEVKTEGNLELTGLGVADMSGTTTKTVGMALNKVVGPLVTIGS